jgi:hypothetical protein
VIWAVIAIVAALVVVTVTALAVVGFYVARDSMP